MSALPITVDQPGTRETVTVLQAKPGLAMTKTFTPTEVKSYDRAKYFTPKPQEVRGIRDLSVLLTRLESHSRCCIIRGIFKGPEFASQVADAVDGPDLFQRKKVLFDDVPKRMCLIDIDGFIPQGDYLAVDEPVKAIEEFIDRHLPECFQGKSYHWQLSSSAGTPGKEHLLKAHVWFWLETAYTSQQMNAWAKSIGTAVDSAVFRTVQVHYTANPIFKDGAQDPVKIRSGFEDGWDGDTVPLVLDEVLLLRAAEREESGEDDEFEFADPRDKPGVIGAFCRAYTVEEVLDDFLSDEFSWEDGSDRRVTWHNGGGTPGGCFVTDDRQHLVSIHNTDPLDNRATNMFDLVRHYRFGHLDEGQDAFAIMEMRDKPSYQAMCAWAETLEPVKAELAKGVVAEQVEARTTRESLIDLVKAAADEADLRERVCASIREQYRSMEKADLKMIAAAVAERFKSLTGTKLNLAEAGELFEPARQSGAVRQNLNGNLPGWAQDYVFVTSRSQIYRYDSNEWLDRAAFEFKHNWQAGVDEEGYQISAYNLLRDSPAMVRVEQALYMPQLGPTFELDGMACVNTYRPSTVPAGKPVPEWTPEDTAAVGMAERHIELLCGGRPNIVRALLDWLAFCVQNPGNKITYTWLIVGGEGAGKSWIGNMMATAMGGPNVRMVSVQEVLNPTFNGWAEGAAFAVIEEIRIAGHKQDAWDNLKPVLTNPVIPIVRKGKDGYNTPNVTNYLLFSNHDDALPLSLGSRRAGVIKTPFGGDETAAQLNAMAQEEGFIDSAAYFDELFRILGEHGPAIREWLMSRKLDPSFNHKGRAPETDEKAVMVNANMSHEETVIRDVIEEGGHGITTSVVSPKHLAVAVQMWEDGGFAATPESLYGRLKRLGYTKYPHRVHCSKEEKLRLWVKNFPLSGNEKEDKEALRNHLGFKRASGTEDDFLN